MLEYKVIYKRSSSNLEAEVNNYMLQGWIPQGGVSSAGELGMLLQAMVREVTNTTTTGEVR